MTTERELVIPTLAGVRYAAPGDWIIRGALGEIYPCKPHIFEATYDAVLEDKAPQVTNAIVSWIETKLP